VERAPCPEGFSCYTKKTTPKGGAKETTVPSIPIKAQ